MKLLRIDSSARRSSVSRQLTAKFTETWKQENPEGEIVERDLALTQLPLITDDWTGTFGDPSKLTPGQRQYLSTSDALIEELISTDTIVIGAPMYNFSISSSLKAWIDQVVRAGTTVSFGPEGPKGLISGKKVVVITSRGGAYQPGTTDKPDYLEHYLRDVLGFIGLTDLTFIHADRQMQAEAAPALALAVARIEQAVSQLA